MTKFDFNNFRCENEVFMLDVIIDEVYYATIKVIVKDDTAVLDYDKSLQFFKGLNGSIIVSEIFIYVLNKLDSVNFIKTRYEKDCLNYADMYGIEVLNEKDDICYSFKR